MIYFQNFQGGIFTLLESYPNWPNNHLALKANSDGTNFIPDLQDSFVYADWK